MGTFRNAIESKWTMRDYKNVKVPRSYPQRDRAHIR